MPRHRALLNEVGNANGGVMLPDNVYTLDEKGKPREIPDIAPETDVEIRRYKEGKDRTLTRKKELK